MMVLSHILLLGKVIPSPGWNQSSIQCILKYALKKVKGYYKKRTIGSANVKALPNYPEECSWMIKND